MVSVKNKSHVRCHQHFPSQPTSWEKYMPDFDSTVIYKISFLGCLTSKCCLLEIFFLQVRIKALTLLHDLMLEVDGLGNLVKEAGICQV